MIQEICFKCNKPTELVRKRIRCTGCNYWIRDCLCSKIIIEPPKEELVYIKNRFQLIIQNDEVKKRWRLGMFDKFWETIKYIFDWDDSTKIMIFGIACMAVIAVISVEVGRWSINSNNISTQQAINADNLKSQRDKALLLLQTECVTTQRPLAECQNFK